MDELKRVCPECGTENSIFALTCNKCAFPFSSIKTCPECNQELTKQQTVCPNCGCPIDSKNNFITNIIEKRNKIIGIALLIIALVLCIVAAKTRYSEIFSYYDYLIQINESNIRVFKDNRRDAQNSADSYYPGFFKDNYEYIVSQYNDLIYDAERNIENCRKSQSEIKTKAVILFLLGIICGGIAILFIKNIDVKEKIKNIKIRK